MSECWVVVADAARARLFRQSPERALEEFDSMVNPEGRMKEQDLASDEPGHGLNRARAGRFGMSGRENMRERSDRLFAGNLAARLDQARLDRQLDRLHLVAAPKFLGLLRQHLDDETRALVRSEIAKDLSQHDRDAIRAQLPEYL